SRALWTTGVLVALAAYAGGVGCDSGRDTTILLDRSGGPGEPTPPQNGGGSGGEDPGPPLGQGGGPGAGGELGGLDEQPLSAPYLGLPSALELTAPGWSTAPAFSKLTFDIPVAMVKAPRLETFFVAELHGRIYAFDDDQDVSQKKLVLDLTAHTQGTADCGLITLAFHPEFAQQGSPNAGYVYLLYAYSATPLDPGAAPPSTPTLSRLSRFTVDLNTLEIDPSSELVLIDQEDQSTWHQGSGMFFHPDDGFLYISVGDEGERYCALQNCQRIDGDLFSGVLRIDVDQRGGNISHPIPRQPTTGTTAGYYIPNDNPFVGQTNVLEEFYALGLRNPYRMTFDAVDGLAWIGEVGQNTHEEIDVLLPGGNYQWNAYEGDLRSRGALPPTPLGVWTGPVVSLERAEAECIIGGYVYRGQRFPELQGKYVFADYTLSKLYALSYTRQGGQVQAQEVSLLIDGVLGKRETITSFATDTAGELYMLIYGEGTQIQRLDKSAGVTTAPGLLSEVGAFSDLSELSAEDTLLPYTVQTPLWSDGASKDRWISLPEGGRRIGFAANGPWRFPPGTVFVKHFEMALDERRPERRRRLETRFLVAAEDDAFYGVSYKWNAEGTDAELMFESQSEDLEIIDADGDVRHQTYFYPGPADCLTCHTAEAGHVLGFRTAQLNGDHEYEATGRRANQLITLGALGLLDAEIDPDLPDYPRLSPLDDTSASVYDRVRSYWDSNCAMCHGVRSEIRSAWDARFQTRLSDRGLVLAPSYDGTENVFLVVPGDADSSLLFERDATTDPGLKMPPLGRNLNDERYIQLLREWIDELPPPLD
ncbi:MAG: PQQ-dependent sugar dehydrogenase, partial [Polyangiaceae bacterium]